jgi:uncharacterized RDD family membrane protein YckC
MVSFPLMESGPPPPDRDRRPGEEGSEDDTLPQAPPPGPQAPAPGPQAPAPGPEAPAPGPEAAPGYGGPVPPGGWEQPVSRPQEGWVGRPLASWGSRVAAAVIDWLLLLIPTVILFFVVVAGAVGISGDDDVSTGGAIAAIVLYIILISAVWLLYAPLLMMREGAHNGQTLGKQLVGITVVRNTGQPMGFGWAALREVVIKGLVIGIASSIIPVIPWLLDVLWPLWDDQNRALHDMAVQTHVVRV